MPTITEEFLKTEEAANTLLEALEDLRTETQHYSSAATALDAAGRGLNGLVGQAADLTSGIREVVLRLKDIGTPQLLEGLGALSARFEEHRNELHGLARIINQSAAETVALNSTIQTLANQVQASVGAATSKVDALAAATEQRLEDLTNSSARLLRASQLTSWTGWIAILASLATLVYLLVTHR